MARDDDRELGMAGLLMAGYTPAQAWHEIRKAAIQRDVQAIIAGLKGTTDGLAALRASRRQWARYGLPPPWDLTAKPPPRDGGGST
jgi:predicted component of type VI protein secretion system